MSVFVQHSVVFVSRSRSCTAWLPLYSTYEVLETVVEAPGRCVLDMETMLLENRMNFGLSCATKQVVLQRLIASKAVPLVKTELESKQTNG